MKYAVVIESWSGTRWYGRYERVTHTVHDTEDGALREASAFVLEQWSNWQIGHVGVEALPIDTDPDAPHD